MKNLVIIKYLCLAYLVIATSISFGQVTTNNLIFNTNNLKEGVANSFNQKRDFLIENLNKLGSLPTPITFDIVLDKSNYIQLTFQFAGIGNLRNNFLLDTYESKITPRAIKLTYVNNIVTIMQLYLQEVVKDLIFVQKLDNETINAVNSFNYAVILKTPQKDFIKFGAYASGELFHSRYLFSFYDTAYLFYKGNEYLVQTTNFEILDGYRRFCIGSPTELNGSKNENYYFCEFFGIE